MEIKKVDLVWTDCLTKRSFTKKVEIGKWFRFRSASQEYSTYGKVVKIENDEVFAEKVFELPNYRPYAGTKWFDNLPTAIL